MFLNNVEKSLYAQLLLTAENEHFSCESRPAPTAGRHRPVRPGGPQCLLAAARSRRWTNSARKMIVLRRQEELLKAKLLK